MNEQNNEENSTASESLEKVGGFPWKVVFRVFLFRIPLWLVAALIVVSGGWLGYSSITKEEPANLRPIITDAIKVDITITTCNDKIDEAGIEIREEEKRLEEKFKKIEGVQNADVYIERDQVKCKLIEDAAK